jgi:hypothetical protein
MANGSGIIQFTGARCERDGRLGRALRVLHWVRRIDYCRNTVKERRRYEYNGEEVSAQRNNSNGSKIIGSRNLTERIGSKPGEG